MLSREGDANNPVQAGLRHPPRRSDAVSGVKSPLGISNFDAETNQALGVSRFTIKKARRRNHLGGGDHYSEGDHHCREGQCPLGSNGPALSPRK